MPFLVTLGLSSTVPLSAPEAHSFEHAERELLAQVPDGHELTDIRITHSREAGRMAASGTARPVETKVVSGEDRAGLLDDVPEGWRALSIRRA